MGDKPSSKNGMTYVIPWSDMSQNPWMDIGESSMKSQISIVKYYVL